MIINLPPHNTTLGGHFVGLTLLHMATIWNKNKAVRHLLYRRANPNACTWKYIWIGTESQHYTPLHYAARIANNRATKLLLDAKAKIPAKARSMQMSPQSEIKQMYALGTRAQSSKTDDIVTTLDLWKSRLTEGRNPSPPHRWPRTHPPQLPLDATSQSCMSWHCN